MSATVIYRTGLVLDEITAKLARGMSRAVKFCESDAKRRVSRGNKDGKSPSAPGESPKTVTGTLRANIGSEVVIEPGVAVRGFVGIRKGPAEKYGRRLELGFVGTVAASTRRSVPVKAYKVNQGARPFLRPAVLENGAAIAERLGS